MDEVDGCAIVAGRVRSRPTPLKGRRRGYRLSVRPRRRLKERSGKISSFVFYRSRTGRDRARKSDRARPCDAAATYGQSARGYRREGMTGIVLARQRLN
jgi:hypothetical protein